jgi:hypothetical protein
MTPCAPIPDSYWVVPARVAAGEYPARGSVPPRVRNSGCSLTRASAFIDLTEQDELRPYRGDLEGSPPRGDQLLTTSDARKIWTYPLGHTSATSSI